MQLRVQLTEAYESRGVIPPRTDHVEIWRHRGHPLTVCKAVVLTRLKDKRKEPPGSLRFFDRPIAEACRNPLPEAVKPTEAKPIERTPEQWAKVVQIFRNIGRGRTPVRGRTSLDADARGRC